LPRLGLSVAIELDRCLRGRSADAAHRDHRLPVQLDQHRDLATDAEAALLSDRSSEDRSYAGVDGVASLRQNTVACLNFEVVGGAHHLVRTAYGREHSGAGLRGENRGENSEG